MERPERCADAVRDMSVTVHKRVASLMDDRVGDLRDRIARGEYEVDPHAVAEAIVRRLRDRALARAALGLDAPTELEPPQKECSYPDRGSSRSTNVTPGGPAATRPIQVRRAPLSQVALAASAISRALPGMQAQSS